MEIGIDTDFFCSRSSPNPRLGLDAQPAQVGASGSHPPEFHTGLGSIYSTGRQQDRNHGDNCLSDNYNSFVPLSPRSFSFPTDNPNPYARRMSLAELLNADAGSPPNWQTIADREQGQFSQPDHLREFTLPLPFQPYDPDLTVPASKPIPLYEVTGPEPAAAVLTLKPDMTEKRSLSPDPDPHACVPRPKRARVNLACQACRDRKSKVCMTSSYLSCASRE